MYGNVWEWVEDDWHDNYNGAPDDGRAWIEEPRGASRVARGASWLSNVASCQSASRIHYSRGYRQGNVGFGLGLARSAALGP